MTKYFSADDVTSFLNESIGKYLDEIESIAKEMAHVDDKGFRLALLDDVREVIWQCNKVLK